MRCYWHTLKIKIKSLCVCGYNVSRPDYVIGRARWLLCFCIGHPEVFLYISWKFKSHVVCCLIWIFKNKFKWYKIFTGVYHVIIETVSHLVKQFLYWSKEENNFLTEKNSCIKINKGYKGGINLEHRSCLSRRCTGLMKSVKEVCFCCWFHLYNLIKKLPQQGADNWFDCFDWMLNHIKDKEREKKNQKPLYIYP